MRLCAAARSPKRDKRAAFRKRKNHHPTCRTLGWRGGWAGISKRAPRRINVLSKSLSCIASLHHLVDIQTTVGYIMASYSQCYFIEKNLDDCARVDCSQRSRA